MRHWCRKAIVIRRSAEIVIVLAAVAWTVFFLASDGGTIFGIWDTIALVESAIFGILAIAYRELTLDPRLAQREVEFVRPVILRMFKLCYFLLPVLLICFFVVRYSSFHLPKTTILFDAVFFLFDVSMLCFVVSLLVALVRLNRGVRSHLDARS